MNLVSAHIGMHRTDGDRKPLLSRLIEYLEENPGVRSQLAIGFVLLSWLTFSAERLEVADPGQLARDTVAFLIHVSYIGLFIVIAAVITRILWIEFRGVRSLRSVEAEHLDVIEKTHPYLPKPYQILVAALLLLALPMILWSCFFQPNL